jgi:hypothetical protein
MTNVIELPNKKTALQQLKEQVDKKLQRDVGVEQTTRGKFICKYLSFGAPLSTLVGDTEYEAYEKLLNYLNTVDTDPPSAA